MGFFLTIIVLFIFVVILILSIAFGFLRSLFGFGRRRNSQQQTDTFSDNNPIDKQKIFDKNEGEYVDFEEVKE
jgi:hypothetical protein